MIVNDIIFETLCRHPSLAVWFLGKWENFSKRSPREVYKHVLGKISVNYENQ